MTIPEEMMAVIQETARKAAREGAKEVIAEQTRKAAGRCDRRLRNTKLLLKNTARARSIRTKRVTMTARKKKLRWNCLI